MIGILHNRFAVNEPNYTEVSIITILKLYYSYDELISNYILMCLNILLLSYAPHKDWLYVIKASYLPTQP